MTADVLKSYALDVRAKLRANRATPETGLAPAFQRLIETLLPSIPAIEHLEVSPEYRKSGVGRPDIALIKHGELPRAFIELKAPGKASDPKRWTTPHDKRQYERLQELQHWSASNFVDFHLFERGKQIGKAAIVPAEALDPDTSDKAADAAIDAHDPTRFLDLLAQLARAQPPVATNAEQLAELMAHSARIVKSAVRERVGELDSERDRNDPLMLVRQTYRNVLYAHPEAGGYAAADFDELFASAFAQTLAFGLLLVREHLAHTETDEEKRKVGPDAARHMPAEHPLMKGTLEAIEFFDYGYPEYELVAATFTTPPCTNPTIFFSEIDFCPEDTCVAASFTSDRPAFSASPGATGGGIDLTAVVLTGKVEQMVIDDVGSG